MPKEGRPRWHMIRSVFGIESFGINAWRATEVGQQIIGEHDELGGGAGGHEELYFVLSGRATFTIAGDPVDAPAGSLVYIKDPATRRSAVADEAATEILVIGGRAGAAFSVSGWERSAEASRSGQPRTGTARSSSSTDSWRRIRTTGTSSTTSRAPRAGGAETRPRSSTWPGRWSSCRDAASGPGRTRTSSRCGEIRDSKKQSARSGHRSRRTGLGFRRIRRRSRRILQVGVASDARSAVAGEPAPGRAGA